MPSDYAPPLYTLTTTKDETDPREQLWIAVVVETIREAGAIRDGGVFDRADESVDRFDRKFGVSDGN